MRSTSDIGDTVVCRLALKGRRQQGACVQIGVPQCSYLPNSRRASTLPLHAKDMHVRGLRWQGQGFTQSHRGFKSLFLNKMALGGDGLQSLLVWKASCWPTQAALFAKGENLGIGSHENASKAMYIIPWSSRRPLANLARND